MIKLVKDQKTPVDTALLSNLTPRQRKIFKLMIEKKTNKEIADQIGYSTSTIKQETISIYEILLISDVLHPVKIMLHPSILLIKE